MSMSFAKELGVAIISWAAIGLCVAGAGIVLGYAVGALL